MFVPEWKFGNWEFGNFFKSYQGKNVILFDVLAAMTFLSLELKINASLFFFSQKTLPKPKPMFYSYLRIDSNAKHNRKI